MTDFLNPVSPRNPASQVTEVAKSVVPEIDTSKFEEGSEEISIPSKGVFYRGLFFQKESLWCRHLDFRDEDILTTQRFMEEGTVFDKVVDAVIQENINSKKLVPIDRDTILLWLRANAMGKDMTVEYTCPSCQSKQAATWDLSTFKIPQYKEEHLAELMEKGELRIELPLSNVVVYITVPLIEESKDTERRYSAKKEKENIEYDLNATASLNLILSGVEVPIEGEETVRIIRNKNEMMNYLKKIKLPLSDSRYIRTKAKEINLKYDTAQDLVCKKCGHIQEGVELPIIHQNFLWSDLSS